MMTRLMFRTSVAPYANELARFFNVGIIATILDYLVMVFAVELLGQSPVVASLSGYVT